MNKNVLILGCSSRKHAVGEGGMVHAGSLYDGVMYRVVRAWQRNHPVPEDFRVLILSAKYGLITWDTPVASYDQRMTKARARQLLPKVEKMLPLALKTHPENVYVELGKDYLRALPDLAALWTHSRIIFGYGRIGERMRRLKAWLESTVESRRMESSCP